METTIEFLNQYEGLNKIHPASVQIFIDFSVCCFETLFDGDKKKQAFQTMRKLMFVDGSKTARFVYDFILNNLNDLRYKETEAIMISLIEFLAKDLDQKGL